jgi:hypothetical protein
VPLVARGDIAVRLSHFSYLLVLRAFVLKFFRGVQCVQ